MKAFFTLIILFFAVAAFAQSHTYKAGCRYYVAPASATASKDVHAGRLAEDMCPACLKDAKAEEVARIKEKDRVDGIALAKKEAARKAEKEAADKANTERINKIYNSSTKVEYAISKSDKAIKAAPVNIKGKSAVKTPVFYNGYDEFFLYIGIPNYNSSAFIDSKGDTIISNKNWLGTTGAFVYGDKNLDKFPPGYGIVLLKQKDDNSGQIEDIVDIKGQRVLNDDEVWVVNHLGGNYFFCIKGAQKISLYKDQVVDFREISEQCFFYNITSRKKEYIDVKQVWGITVPPVKNSSWNLSSTLGLTMNDKIGVNNWTSAIMFITPTDNKTFTIYYIDKLLVLKTIVVTTHEYFDNHPIW